MDAHGVSEICSVSECVSPGAPGWVDRWLYNELGWFNRISDAMSVIPSGEEAEYRLFAYRIHAEVFTPGGRVPLEIPEDVRPEPIAAGFQRLGFDCANKSMASVSGLECSPLSCNALATELAANESCLFVAFSEAVAAAERFAAEQPEPGHFYIVEVLERSKEAA